MAKKKPATAPERLYTSGEAALLIGCDPSHLRRMARLGRIRAVRQDYITTVAKVPSHRFMFPESAVEEFKASNSVAQGWPRGVPRPKRKRRRKKLAK